MQEYTSQIKCFKCGSEKNLQTHHISYDPEVTETLCVECHGDIHDGHGVGTANGILKYPREVREKAVNLVKNGSTCSEVARELEPTFPTVRKWCKDAGVDSGGAKVRGYVSSKRKVIKVGDSLAITLPKKWLDIQKWLGEEVTELHTLANDVIILVRPEEKERAKKILEMFEENEK